MPSLADIGRSAARRITGKEGVPADAKAWNRIRGAATHVLRFEPRWRELWAHFDGDQYAEVSAVDGSLLSLETRDGSSAKPRFRSRLVRNRMTKSITAECSVLTSRFPQYEVAPANTDPEKINAARTGEKVLQFLHGLLKLRRVVFKVAVEAAVTGDGYAWPYWNPSLGDIVDASEIPAGMNADGTPVGSGKVKITRAGDISIAVLRQDQVLWEPNVEFDESRWHCVRLVRPVEEIMGREDYTGPESLSPDAAASTLQMRDKAVDSKLCFLYHYLERPSNEFPKGRWLQIAGGSEVAPKADYPSPRDVPVIHRLPWIERGSRRDRSLGLGEMVIDIQRSINRICNQIIAWRNLVLNPQVFAPEGSIVDELTEEPGLVTEFRGSVAPTWREVPDIPVTLFKDLEQAYADMDFVVQGGADLPAGISSGSGIQALNEREMSFRAMLVGNLADFYSSLGTHLLELVAEHYSEQRLIEIKGRFGVESIPDFVGTTLKGTFTGVRVSEGSITPRTRAAQEAKIMAFADKGWITPQAAMSALNGGTADVILDAFELDIARVHRQIQALVLLDRNGDDPKLASADPAALLPEAKPYDNHGVFIDVIEQWCKTVEFEQLHPFVQLAAQTWLEMHQRAQADEQMRQAQLVQAQGIAQGASNAARPATPGGAPTPTSVASSAQALAGQTT